MLKQQRWKLNGSGESGSGVKRPAITEQAGVPGCPGAMSWRPGPAAKSRPAKRPGPAGTLSCGEIDGMIGGK